MPPLPLLKMYAAGNFSSVIGVTRFRFATIGALALLLTLFNVVTGQDAATPDSDSAAPVLIRRASANEVAALQSPEPFRYLERLQWSWGTETREVIETREGRVDRIVEFNDGPVAPDQARKQELLLRKLLNDFKAARHEIEDQYSETRRRIRMMKAFAAAFIFEPSGSDHGLLKFSFRPNRSFSPKDRETQVYRGMHGTVWVDPKQERLTKIEGTLTRDVSFGWGIFGKLYKGGRYLLEQTQVEPRVWRITTLDLELKMRVFLNTSHLLRREHDKEFSPSPPDLTYKQAVQMLLKADAGPEK